MSFQSSVGLKYQVYNSIFLTLGLDSIRRTGNLIPVFLDYCEEGFKKSKTPVEVVDDFMDDHKEFIPQDEQLDILFRFIQYIERQVVLVDALEDASFNQLLPATEKNTLVRSLNSLEDTWTQDEILKALSDFSMRIVLTAHPTQFYPGSVLGILTELSNAVRLNNLEDIRLLLEQLGKTPFFNRIKPTPYDEARSLNWYLQNIFYDTVPSIYHSIVKHMDIDVDAVDFSRLIQLGFWPGGDRDGNPFVTAETTYAVARKLNHTVLRCYYQDVRNLKKRLTFRNVDRWVEYMESKLSDAIFKFEDVKEVDLDDHVSFDLDDLIKPLHRIKNTLLQDYDGLFVELVDNILVKISAFKNHLASLDIRQDSRKVQALVDAYPEIKALSIQDLLSFSGGIKMISLEDEVSGDLQKIFSVVKNIQREYGELACHRFIISNTRSARSVAQIFAMAKGLAFGHGEPLPLDIVPLFETIEDLRNAPAEMEVLFSHPEYAQHIKARGMRQDIMLGFSDGTKDGGYFAANWQIYKAKRALSEVGRKYNVELAFFDGRGGPPARGGGEVHQYYAAQGKDIINKHIQLTIQGQTVSFKFGNKDKANYYLERLLGAGIRLQNPELLSSLEESDFEIMDHIADKALAHYQALRQHPSFMDYLVECSPLRFFGETNVASRPAKRGNTNKLTLDDLRAIPFVSSWNQLKQNVPGFYGFGHGLSSAIEAFSLDRLKLLYKNSILFKSLVSNSMQALSKTRFDITQYLKEDPLWNGIYLQIEKEFDQTVELLLAITEQQELLEDQKLNKESINLREHITLPLTAIQQYGLMKIKNADEKDQKAYAKLITRTMYGIINAARNSA